MHDINSEKSEVILLLHPMLADAGLMKKLIADNLGRNYRYLIPDLSGCGEACEEKYKTAEKEAEAIEDYLRKENIKKIKLGYASSLGAVVLMRLISFTESSFERFFFEGASLYEKGKIYNFFMQKLFDVICKRAEDSPEAFISKMKGIYGKTAGENMGKNMLSLSKEAISNIVRDCCYVFIPSLNPGQQQNCVFAYGENDFNLKKAKSVIPKKFPMVKLHIWKNSGHCTFMTGDPKEYCINLQKFIDDGQLNF